MPERRHHNSSDIGESHREVCTHCAISSARLGRGQGSFSATRLSSAIGPDGGELPPAGQPASLPARPGATVARFEAEGCEIRVRHPAPGARTPGRACARRPPPHDPAGRTHLLNRPPLGASFSGARGIFGDPHRTGVRCLSASPFGRFGAGCFFRRVQDPWLRPAAQGLGAYPRSSWELPGAACRRPWCGFYLR